MRPVRRPGNHDRGGSPSSSRPRGRGTGFDATRRVRPKDPAAPFATWCRRRAACDARGNEKNGRATRDLARACTCCETARARAFVARRRTPVRKKRSSSRIPVFRPNVERCRFRMVNSHKLLHKIFPQKKRGPNVERFIRSGAGCSACNPSGRVGTSGTRRRYPRLSRKRVDLRRLGFPPRVIFRPMTGHCTCMMMFPRAQVNLPGEDGPRLVAS